MKAFVWTSLLALLAVGTSDAASSAGCGKSAGMQSGTFSINVKGKQREYMVKVPQNYNSKTPYKLIFTLHWRGGNMHDAANEAGGYYGLQALAKDSAIFVSPNGLNAGWANSGGEDLAFIDALVEKMDTSFCIDQSQRFSTGFSYGAGMSYEIACARPDKFRAVALLSGAQLSGCDGGNKPIAFWSAHGTHDSVLSFSMGQGLRDHFVKTNGCQAQNAPQPSQGSGTHIKTEYKGCSSGHPVWWYAHDGDHVPNPSDRGQPTWAPAETWKFFSQFGSSGESADVSPASPTNNSTSSATTQPTTPKPTTTKTKSPTAPTNRPTSHPSQKPSNRTACRKRTL